MVCARSIPYNCLSWESFSVLLYGLLVCNICIGVADSYISVTFWSTVVLDEAHKAKDKNSNSTRNLQKVIGKRSRILMLTGTPLMNRLEVRYRCSKCLGCHTFSVIVPSNESSLLPSTQTGTIPYPHIGNRPASVGEVGTFQIPFRQANRSCEAENCNRVRLAARIKGSQRASRHDQIMCPYEKTKGPSR